jgi:hypothetical protein
VEREQEEIGRIALGFMQYVIECIFLSCTSFASLGNYLEASLLKTPLDQIQERDKLREADTPTRVEQAM